MDRDRVRAALADGDFVEIFVDAPIEVARRATRRASTKRPGRATQGFYGIDDPYEPPLRPELVLNAARKSPEALADEVLAYLKATGKIAGG